MEKNENLESSPLIKKLSILEDFKKGWASLRTASYEIVLIYILTVLIFYSLTIISSVLELYLVDELGQSDLWSGFFYAAMGFSMAVYSIAFSCLPNL